MSYSPMCHFYTTHVSGVCSLAELASHLQYVSFAGLPSLPSLFSSNLLPFRRSLV